MPVDEDLSQEVQSVVHRFAAGLPRRQLRQLLDAVPGEERLLGVWHPLQESSARRELLARAQIRRRAYQGRRTENIDETCPPAFGADGTSMRVVTV